MNKKTRIFIAASVVLNLLLMGLVGGHIWKRAHYAGYWSSERFSSEKLPREQALKLQEEMWKIHKPDPKARAAIRASRKNTAAIMSAEHFDAAAYRAAMKESQTLYSNEREARLEKIIKLAEGLSQSERKAMAEMMRRPPHGKRHKPSSGDKD